MLNCTQCPKYDTCSTPCDWLLMQLEQEHISVQSFPVENIDSIGDSMLTLPQHLSESEKNRIKIMFVMILRPKQKEVWDLYNTGLTHEQIANRLSVSRSTVTERLKSIQKTMQKQFHIIISKTIKE